MKKKQQKENLLQDPIFEDLFHTQVVGSHQGDSIFEIKC